MRDDDDHISVTKETLQGSKYSVELTMEDDSEKFNLNDWVEEQKEKIRKLEN